MTSGNMSRHDSPGIVVNVTSFDREYLHWSFIIIEVAAVVVIVIGDISMLMMFFTRKLLGQSTNILVFSVGIGDLMTGLMTLPLAMMQKILLEPSDFLCKGYFYFSNVSKTAVGYTILLLAMERIIAVLMHTFRILPPGRCLFFASLTWFFSAAYNIWSVVIYDVEIVQLVSDRRTSSFFLCFASTRFMYLHDIFAVLNPLVTFTFPALCSSLLFLYFLRNKREADKPGRPYKSSKSVVIFTFALLVSFVASHLPWEIATLVLRHDAPEHYSKQLVSLKVLHLISFSRGFWDIFIFGAFRHYVCKKEKALAHFREQRSLQVQRSSLAIPLSERPISTSLLDSDPSVSRRYSSDISRRPSAFDDPHSCQIEQHNGHMPTEDDAHRVLINPHVFVEDTTPPIPGSPVIQVVPVLTYTYLVPRSPCVWESTRSLMFPPNKEPKGEQLGRQNTLPGKARFGSCEIIAESLESSDSVGDLLKAPAKGRHDLRRKSCGDKVSHLQVRAAKHAMYRHANAKEVKDHKAKLHSPSKRNPTVETTVKELHLDLALAHTPNSQPTHPSNHNSIASQVSVITLDSYSDPGEAAVVDEKSHLGWNSDNSCPDVEKHNRGVRVNSPFMPCSKSADVIGSPSLKRSSPGSQDDSKKTTLRAPISMHRKGASCNYLTVPSSISPLVPKSTFASDA